MSDWVKSLLQRVFPWLGASAREWKEHLARLERLPLDEARDAALALLARGAVFQTEPRGGVLMDASVPDPSVRELFRIYPVIWTGELVLAEHEVRELPGGLWQIGHEHDGEVRLLVRGRDGCVYAEDDTDPGGPQKVAPSVFHYLLRKANSLTGLPLPTPSGPSTRGSS